MFCVWAGRMNGIDRGVLDLVDCIRNNMNLALIRIRIRYGALIQYDNINP
jgi:hypothetical protein